MRCPVCEAPGGQPVAQVTDFLLGTTTAPFRIVRCAGCGARHLYPPPPPEALAGFYPPGYWWEPDGAPTLAQRLEGFYRHLVLLDHVWHVVRCARRTRRPRAPRLLDVGCGSGAFLHLCRRYGFAVRGLDASARAARGAAEMYGIEVVVGAVDAAPPDLPAGSCDVITMFHVLEHLHDPVAALTTVSRWLAPDGDLILQVPNTDSLQARGFGGRWYGLDPPRHLVNFNRTSLDAALRRAGFRVQGRRHFSLRDNAAALVSSLFPGIDPMARAVRARRSHPEPGQRRLLLGLLYFGLVLGAQPTAWLESLLRRGATLTVHAKKLRSG